MNILRAINNHPKLISPASILLLLSACMVSALGLLFVASGSYDDLSTRTDYDLSIKYSQNVYTLNQGLSLTLDDEYTSDSELKRANNTPHPPFSSLATFVVSHPYTQTETISYNIFHYETYLGFFPLRSPPLLS